MLSGNWGMSSLTAARTTNTTFDSPPPPTTGVSTGGGSGVGEQAERSWCSSCKDRLSSLSCRGCHASFCKSCCSKVHEKTAFRKHVVVAIEYGARGQVRLCREHDWEKLTLYCVKDGCFVCMHCMLYGRHKGHDGKSLQRAVVEGKEQLSQHRLTIQENTRAVTVAQQRILHSQRHIKDVSATLQADVASKVDELRSVVLADVQASLLSRVKHEEASKLGMLQLVMDAVNQSLAVINAEIATTQQLLQEDDMCAFLEREMQSSLDEPAEEDDESGDGGITGGVSSALRLRLPALDHLVDCSFGLRLDMDEQYKCCQELAFDNSEAVNDGPRSSSSSRLEPSTPSASNADTDEWHSQRAPYATDAMELERVAVIAHPSFASEDLTSEDRWLLWKHRVTLTDNKKALLKLFGSLNWQNDRHVHQLLHFLLPQWAEVDLDDALAMLHAQYAYPEVRQLAVRTLQKITDEDLVCYLLPFVQAARHESDEHGPLASFLVTRAVAAPRIAMSLYWCLTVERHNLQHGMIYSKIHRRLLDELIKQPSWLSHDRVPLVELFRRQDSLMSALTGLAFDAKRHRESRPKKVERLRALLSPGGTYYHLNNFHEPVHLPHEPATTVCGISVEDSTMFKSAQYPIKLVFRTTDKGKRTVILKNNHDLRRDQLVCNTVSLMDRFLQQEGVDLKINTYDVLATSFEVGLVEYIPSISVAKVLADHGNDIRSFLHKHNPNKNSNYHTHHHLPPDQLDVSDIDPTVIDTFTRSCAGYCVISYLMGIGDRHLDNLLLTTDGHLFHVDFEYILGTDPKPFAPPMKLCKEMVMAMGGKNSVHYAEFLSYCCKAFLILRKSAHLFVNLFALVSDPDIFDSTGKQDNPVQKFQERFKLPLSEEEAVAYMRSIIEESMGAVFPQVVEFIHKWRQYWKS